MTYLLFSLEMMKGAIIMGGYHMSQVVKTEDRVEVAVSTFSLIIIRAV